VNVKFEKLSKKSAYAIRMISVQDFLVVKPRETWAVGASEEETEKIQSVSDELQQNTACNSSSIRTSDDPDPDIPPYYKFVDDVKNLGHRGMPT
jgi:hypothetical protein